MRAFLKKVGGTEEGVDDGVGLRDKAWNWAKQTVLNAGNNDGQAENKDADARKVTNPSMRKEGDISFEVSRSHLQVQGVALMNG